MVVAVKVAVIEEVLDPIPPPSKAASSSPSLCGAAEVVIFPFPSHNDPWWLPPPPPKEIQVGAAAAEAAEEWWWQCHHRPLSLLVRVARWGGIAASDRGHPTDPRRIRRIPPRSKRPRRCRFPLLVPERLQSFGDIYRRSACAQSTNLSLFA